jgi:hypothetical protein
MVLRTDRLGTGGNVLKAAFASLHAYLSGASLRRSRDTVKSAKIAA